MSERRRKKPERKAKPTAEVTAKATERAKQYLNNVSPYGVADLANLEEAARFADGQVRLALDTIENLRQELIVTSEAKRILKEAVENRLRKL